MRSKICHITTYFDDRDATTRRTMHEIACLKSLGYEVHLLTGREVNQDYVHKKRQEGLNISVIPSLGREVAPRDDLKALWSIFRILTRNHYDLVHTHLAKAGFLGRLAAWAAGVPFIVHGVHGCTFPDFRPRLSRGAFLGMERLAGKFTSRFIFVGQELMEHYRRYQVGDPAAYSLIYTGQDLSPFTEAARMPGSQREQIRGKLNLRPEDVVVGLVGRLVPGKGHLLALMAVKILKERFPGLKLIFVGDPYPPSATQLQTQLEDLIKAWNLEKSVLLVGHQSDVARFYAIFDILVVPSEFEGLPNVVVEAAVMQLPVVAFDCDGVREILGDLANPVPQGDASGFVRRLEEEIQRLGEANGNREKRKAKAAEVASRWSLNDMLTNTAQVYEEIFKGQPDATALINSSASEALVKMESREQAAE